MVFMDGFWVDGFMVALLDGWMVFMDVLLNCYYC